MLPAVLLYVAYIASSSLILAQINAITVNIQVDSNQVDITIPKGSNPCAVLKEYCQKNSRTEKGIQQCVLMIQPMMVHELTSSPANWNTTRQELTIDASLFMDCTLSDDSSIYTIDPQTLHGTGKSLREFIDDLVKSSTTHEPYTSITDELLYYLEQVPEWINDEVSLKYFHKRRLELNFQTDQERVKLYEKAITIFPTSLFMISNFGTVLTYSKRFDLAEKVYLNAVQRGLWDEVMQRPEIKYVPGLYAAPWHDITKYPFISYLEKNYLVIRDEFIENLQKAGKLKIGLKTDINNIHIGNWQLSRLIHNEKAVNVSDQFPQTMELIRNCNANFIDVLFSTLQPGTRIRPHTGPFNGRLRTQIALLGTKGAHIRVGQEWRTWKEGKALMFDSSFEHEVKHLGNSTRAVLIVDIWHPELAEDERVPLIYTD